MKDKLKNLHRLSNQVSKITLEVDGFVRDFAVDYAKYHKMLVPHEGKFVHKSNIDWWYIVDSTIVVEWTMWEEAGKLHIPINYLYDDAAYEDFKIGCVKTQMERDNITNVYDRAKKLAEYNRLKIELGIDN